MKKNNTKIRTSNVLAFFSLCLYNQTYFMLFMEGHNSFIENMPTALLRLLEKFTVCCLAKNGEALFPLPFLFSCVHSYSPFRFLKVFSLQSCSCGPAKSGCNYDCSHSLKSFVLRLLHGSPLCGRSLICLLSSI